ncbi:hypothetical protein HPB50_020119 [Hyalomma asiaticum]|uniref:Uncharacterized protein n=1 Tax=Hyalomma asiaticum TaxID=266040 RepID=A0ACB7S6L0_HYAAI|nr:hypothetical protein HPB50_020119 [Hyalomma asiaticum]
MASSRTPVARSLDVSRSDTSLRQRTKLTKAQARLSQDDDRKKRLLELRKAESSRPLATVGTRSTRPPTPGSGSSESSTDRSALLCSITSFNRDALRRTTTKDYSKPKL